MQEAGGRERFLRPIGTALYSRLSRRSGPCGQRQTLLGKMRLCKTISWSKLCSWRVPRHAIFAA
jgi:hypothetical protein